MSVITFQMTSSDKIQDNIQSSINWLVNVNIVMDFLVSNIDAVN